ncbi:MAG: hypothetical protein HXY38_15045 [Chloroflexi bacterium]|nr:hypothetical protein [Chloroflexota bacterium]
MDNTRKVLDIVRAIETSAAAAAGQGSKIQMEKVLWGIEALAQIAGDLLARDLVKIVLPDARGQAS